MPYVARDPDGRIAAVHAIQSAEAQEELAPNGPDLRAFLGQSRQNEGAQDSLVASDRELIRVLEDLISLLIDNQTIKLTDLPRAARRKLAQRSELRGRLAEFGDMADEPEQIMLP